MRKRPFEETASKEEELRTRGWRKQIEELYPAGCMRTGETLLYRALALRQSADRGLSAPIDIRRGWIGPLSRQAGLVPIANVVALLVRAGR